MIKVNDDLRQEDRSPIGQLVLVCYMSQDGDLHNEKHTCNADNISEGGLKIITRRPLPVECHLPIEVLISDPEEQLNTDNFKFNGEVKWCLEVDDSPTYYAGIKLQQVSGVDYHEWKRWIQLQSVSNR